MKSIDLMYKCLKNGEILGVRIMRFKKKDRIHFKMAPSTGLQDCTFDLKVKLEDAPDWEALVKAVQKHIEKEVGK